MPLKKKLKINWIIKKVLAVGTAPRSRTDIEILKNYRIINILSLCSISEVIPPENIEKNFFCKRVVLPDHSYDRKMNITELQYALEVLIDMSKKGPVFIHCKAAVERSPLVCMAWLVREKGLTSQEALTYLMEVNKGTCPSKQNLELLNLIN